MHHPRAVGAEKRVAAAENFAIAVPVNCGMGNAEPHSVITRLFIAATLAPDSTLWRKLTNK